MTRAARLFACGACAAAISLPAHALRIEGLSALEPVVAASVTPVAAAGMLRIALAPQQVLTVAPWPAYLPQRFGTVSLAATRLPLPAGPIDRLSFSDGAGKPAWLEIANGARPSSTIVGAWQLKLTTTGWTARRGAQQTALGAAPAKLAVGHARWCVYLLDTAQPQQRPGLATEQEASAAWAALRLKARPARCPAPRAAPR